MTCSANTESQANTAAAADGSEEASPSTRTQRPSQTEPDVFLFLLSALVRHPQLTVGCIPSLRITGRLGRRDTSPLASPASSLQINKLTLTEDKAPNTPTPGNLPLAQPQLRARLPTSPGEEPH